MSNTFFNNFALAGLLVKIFALQVDLILITRMCGAFCHTTLESSHLAEIQNLELQ